MDVEIHLENPCFPWIKSEGNNLKCWLKGDLFYHDSLLEGPGIITLFSSLPSSSERYHEALKDLLLAFNGSFSLVIETRDNLLCMVDRIRSIPLFYTTTGTQFFLSDDANFLKDQIHPEFNEKTGAEFLVTGYVTGRETLFDGISQIQGGEYLWYTKNDGQITPHFYHRYKHGDYFSGSGEELLKRLDEVFVHVFQRLIASAQKKGLQFVVPLSGGLDSRIIVAMLKRLGVDDVICFTYGKKGNEEAEISKQVAEALGYQWYFVEYTHDKWYQCYHSEEVSAYEHYAGGLSVLPHLQDFLAVRELQKEGRIGKNSVFIPGHSGNLIAGDCLPRRILEIPPDFDHFVTYYEAEHYSLWPWSERGGELEIVFRQRIQQSIGDINIHDTESLADAIEYFNGYERQGKFIVNSVPVYEFLGYSWRVPLWNNELIDFFLKVPLKYRMRYSDSYLYIKYVENILFTNTLKKLWDIDCTTKLKYNPAKTVKKKSSDMIDNNKIVKSLWNKYYFFKKRLFTYNDNPYYGMINKEKFIKLYSDAQGINSFLTLDYLEKFIPFPLDLIKIKKPR